MEKEKGEEDFPERRVTRSMVKEKSEETILGKVTGTLKRWVLGQDQMAEGLEKSGHANVETEENAEANFEAVRNSRKCDQITVR